MTSVEQQYREGISSKLELTVMSWNILAHIHTHWDTELHTGESTDGARGMVKQTSRAEKAFHGEGTT